MRTRARAPSRATARPLGGESSTATGRARGLGDSPDVLHAAQGCSHLRCRAVTGRARRRGAACSPPRGHCQCGGDRPGVGRASPWGSGQCSRPPRGRGISCARWLLPTRESGETSTVCTRGKCTRPSAPPVHRTNNPVRIARRRQARVLAAPAGRGAPAPPRAGKTVHEKISRARPSQEPRDGSHPTTRITRRTRQRSIEFSYHVFTNKTLHTGFAGTTVHSRASGSERCVSGEIRDPGPRVPTRQV